MAKAGVNGASPKRSAVDDMPSWGLTMMITIQNGFKYQERGLNHQKGFLYVVIRNGEVSQKVLP